MDGDGPRRGGGSGTPWLGIFDVEAPGPVLLFAGEGGARKIARRFRAVCEARAVDPATLTVRVCPRVPRLTSEASMLLVEDEVATSRPALVIVDPLYLAAVGARGSDIYDMGAHLAAAQAICQRHGAALVIVHHWNKTGDGRGAKRMSGAGPDAWGRVLISAAVVSRHTDPTTRGSSVVLDLDVVGDEIAETTVRARRRVWAEDPDDLGSPLHYEVEELDVAADDPDVDGLSLKARRVLAALRGPFCPPEGLRAEPDIGDLLAVDGAGPPLKKRTIYEALAELRARGLVTSNDGLHRASALDDAEDAEDAS